MYEAYNFENAEALTPWDGDVADPRNTLLPTCVAVPNFVALGQTVWAKVGVPKIWVTLGPSHLKMRRV